MASKDEAPDAAHEAQLPQSVRQEFEKAAEFSINSTKCVVGDVEFVGNVRTRSSFLRRQFASTLTARSLRDIVISSRDNVQNLRDLGVFDAIEAKILLNEGSEVQGAAAARVQVHLQEKRIVKLKATGSLGGSSGSGGVEATIGNALGFADILAGHVEYGSSHSNSFKCGLTLPRPFIIPSPIKITVQRSILNEMDTQSFSNCVHGAALSLLPRDLRANSSATLSCDLRSLTAKPDTLAQALPTQSMKVALTLSHARNSVDDQYDPYSGTSRSSCIEVAGLGQIGSVHHIKLSHSASMHVPVAILGTPLPSLSAMSLSLAATASLLVPLAGSATSICDRFTLGGPLIMRGCLPRPSPPSLFQSPSHRVLSVTSAPASAPAPSRMQMGLLLLLASSTSRARSAALRHGACILIHSSNC